jgi:hypothetical protein
VARAGEQLANVDLKALRKTQLMERPGEPQKQTGRIVMAIVLVVLALVAGAAIAIKVTQNNSATTAGGPAATAAPTTTPATLPTDYTPVAEQSFVKGCVKRATPAAGAPASGVSADQATPFCECIFTTIRQTIPFATFQEYEKQASASQPLTDPKLKAIVAECATRTAPSTTSPPTS